MNNFNGVPYNVQKICVYLAKFGFYLPKIKKESSFLFKVRTPDGRKLFDIELDFKRKIFREHETCIRFSYICEKDYVKTISYDPSNKLHQVKFREILREIYASYKVLHKDLNIDMFAEQNIDFKNFGDNSFMLHSNREYAENKMKFYYPDMFSNNDLIDLFSVSLTEESLEHYSQLNCKDEDLSKICNDLLSKFKHDFYKSEHSGFYDILERFENDIKGYSQKNNLDDFHNALKRFENEMKNYFKENKFDNKLDNLDSILDHYAKEQSKHFKEVNSRKEKEKNFNKLLKTVEEINEVQQNKINKTYKKYLSLHEKYILALKNIPIRTVREDVENKLQNKLNAEVDF